MMTLRPVAAIALLLLLPQLTLAQTASDCVDDDGDGWGWSNSTQATCRMPGNENFVAARISWQNNPTDQQVDRYEVAVRVLPATQPTASYSSNTTPAIVSFADVGLTAGETFCVSVRAIRDAKQGVLQQLSDWSDETCATLPAAAGDVDVPGGVVIELITGIDE